MVSETSSSKGPFWDFIGRVGDDSQFMGVGLVVASILGWSLAASLYYGGGYHRVLFQEQSCPTSSTSAEEVEETTAAPKTNTELA